MLRLLRTRVSACVAFAYRRSGSFQKAPVKIVATVLATALAASTISVPAFAHDPQTHKGPGILPFIAGPVAAAAIAGTGTSTALLTQHFHFKFWDWAGWHKYFELKKAGWTVDKHFGKHHKVHVDAEKKFSRSNKSTMGKVVVGCIMGSAFGAITSSVRKASAMGNPPSWRSQAEHEKIVASGVEKKYELTNDEAQTAIAFCGLGSFALHWPQKPRS